LQQNFGILLILWCSFKLWWNFCLDQNFSYKGKGPLASNYLVQNLVKVSYFNSRFHIRRRTSRLDEQIVSKSSFSRTNHQMWKRVGQNFRRTSRLNLFDYLYVCEDDFWGTICSSRRLVRL
jgi:hypothetical protein